MSKTFSSSQTLGERVVPNESHSANRKVAIISIHGVADQKKYSTQNNTAQMLLSNSGDATYQTFESRNIAVPCRPVRLARRIDIDKMKSKMSLLQRFMLSGVVTRMCAMGGSLSFIDWQGETTKSLESSEENIYRKSDSIEHEVIREQIQDFENRQGEMLPVKVLSSTRSTVHDDAAIDVDIYEMHWADLSRLKSGVFSAFFEFYLLLMFVSKLGATALERAQTREKKQHRLWRILLASHLIAEYFLVVLIPIAHICLLVTLCGLIPLMLAGAMGDDVTKSVWLGRGLLLVPIGIFYYCAFFIGRTHDNWWSRLYIGATLLSATFLYSLWNIPLTAQILAISLQGVFSLFFVLVLYGYTIRRPGAFAHGLIMLISTLILMGSVQYSDSLFHWISELMASIYTVDLIPVIDVGNLVGKDATVQERVFQRGVAASLIVIWVVALSIAGFSSSSFINFLLGWYILRNTTASSFDAIRRTVWTSSMSLVIPGLAIILITFSLWEVIVWSTKTLLGDCHIISETLLKLLDTQIFPRSEYLSAAMLLTLGYLIWVISPGLLSDHVKSRDDEESVAKLGIIVDKAFDRMNRSCTVFRLALFVFIPASYLYLITHYPKTKDFEHQVILATGLIMLLLWFGSKGPFKTLANGFGAGLDVALDVTNWLRLLPRKSNAKAEIFERYASLLRHINNHQQNGQHYDGVVFVAHSQGSVITADLLRFLKREQIIGNLAEGVDPDLQRLFATGAGESKSNIEMRLLTFGSPLRQIYHLRFPVQYYWSGASNSGGPDPATLNLKHWTNLYNSGDYVGRNLWIPDRDSRRWQVYETPLDFAHDVYPEASEACIGFGGHTSYWGRDSHKVAPALDALIAESVKVS